MFGNILDHIITNKIVYVKQFVDLQLLDHKKHILLFTYEQTGCARCIQCLLKLMQSIKKGVQKNKHNPKVMFKAF